MNFGFVDVIQDSQVDFENERLLFLQSLQSGQFFENLFDCVPGVFYFVKNKKGQFIACSLGFAKALSCQSVEDLLGKRAALNTYIIGGFCGALLYLITHNLFPFFSDMGNVPMLGASAAVMAVFVGLATYSPNFEVMLFGLIRVKMKYLAMIWVAFDVLGLANQDGIAHFAHIGGAIWGYLFIINLKKGKDISNWFDKLKLIFTSLFKKKKIKIVYKKKKSVVKKPTEGNQLRQEKVDAILDKIKISGYDSLSKEDKDYLFDASKNI